jgi:hypothetical protein
MLDVPKMWQNERLQQQMTTSDVNRMITNTLDMIVITK